jgi:Transposase DDE domain
MIVYATDPLFAWARLEDHPQLSTLRDLLAVLPDQALLDGLRQTRGKGRDDFPIAVLWGVVVFPIALRHGSFESCLAELHRNPALCRLIGIPGVDKIPKGWNVSRFLEVLGQEPHLTELRKVFDFIVQRLGIAIPDLGVNTAGDSTGLNGRPKKDEEAVADEIKQGLPQASGGRKEYKDDDGKVTKVVEWFGYKLHLLVDVKHEVPLAWHITDTKAGDNERIKTLVEQAEGNLPEERIKTLAYDKPVRHQMAYMGYEKDREALKYRCPAKHEGWNCPSSQRCNEEREFGMIVRVDPTIDLRRFPPIPRGTKQFEERYKGRTAVERVNARTKIFWGVDDGNVTGSRRFHAYVGVVMVICVALATLLAKTARREGSMGYTRLGPIAQALQETLDKEADQGNRCGELPSCSSAGGDSGGNAQPPPLAGVDSG